MEEKVRMDKVRKQEIIKEFATSENDTGSPYVQIALLTERINNLTEYLKSKEQFEHKVNLCHFQK